MRMPTVRQFLSIVAAATLVTVAALWQAPAVGAQDDEIDCAQEQMTQQAMNICAGRARAESQASLDQLLAELGGKFGDSADGAELAAVQEQWERFRDLDCAWEAMPYAGGSIQPLIGASCLEAHNRARIERLRIFLCDGGAMTGPCEASEKYAHDGSQE